MKTLFIKSNLLHIRTNEGEFEVSNPKDIVDTLIYDAECDIWWLRVLNSDEEPVEFTESSKIEWPGGVELIELPSAKVLGQRGHTNVIKGKKLARLLPKEEKKEPFVKALDDIQKIENLSVNNSAHSFTESAYKTVSSNTQTCGKFEIKSHYDFEPVESSEPAESAYKELEEAAIKQGHVIESSEPQENIFDLPKDVVFDLQRIALADDEMSAGFGAGVEYRLIARSILNKHRKPVSTPSEYQEEIWGEIISEARFYDGSPHDLKSMVNYMKKRFTITRNP